MENNSIKLTQFAKGAGCGCKIAPNVLSEILHSTQIFTTNKKLLVGNGTNDDAAVYDLENGMALISTTDFFTPIVDDAFEFGQVASANAISDVYAMGGKPILAIAILGWPIEKISTSIAQQVIEGSRAMCSKAGINLGGGHTIDAPEPFFGLAVNGLIPIENIKQNNTALENDILFLTKPLGTGILATAQKRDLLQTEHYLSFIQNLTTLNNIGEQLGKIKEVSAMTDITGFGLLGHLIEMADGSNLTAEIVYDNLPILDGVKEYLANRIVPDATYRNWNSYSLNTKFEKGVNVMEAFNLLPDPQTNGGLLFSVKPSAVNTIVNLFNQNGLEQFIKPIGKFIAKQEKSVLVC